MEKLKLSDQVNNYLSILNVPLQKPSYNFLEQICQAHLNTFPFENISKLLALHQNKSMNSEIPNIKQFTTNHTDYNFGGTCYTLNSSLLTLLRELGFSCYHIMLGKEHIGIIVDLDERRYYVDVGAAAPFFKPVRFESKHDNGAHFGKDEVCLLPVDLNNNEFKYIRYTNGKQNGKTWHFNANQAVTINDFREVIKKSYMSAAPFISIFRCQLYQTDQKRCVSIVNNKFSIQYSSGEIEVHFLSSLQQIRQVIEEEFRLPKLPVEEAIEVLNDMKVNIFADRGSGGNQT